MKYIIEVVGKDKTIELEEYADNAKYKNGNLVILSNAPYMYKATLDGKLYGRDIDDDSWEYIGFDAVVKLVD